MVIFLYFKNLFYVLLITVKDNPAEFERTGGWTEYLKPEREEKKGKERKGVSDDDGDSDDDGYGGGEEGMWGGYGGEDDEESDGEFMPEAALLNASYSEIDEADDADSPRLKRKRSQREKSVPPENSPPKSKRTKGEPESDEKTTEKREMRIKERSDADGEGRVMTRTGLAALLMEASEHDEVQLVPLVSKKERRKRKAASGQQRREIVDSEGEAKVKRAEARTVGGEEKSERKRTRTIEVRRGPRAARRRRRELPPRSLPSPNEKQARRPRRNLRPFVLAQHPPTAMKTGSRPRPQRSAADAVGANQRRTATSSLTCSRHLRPRSRSRPRLHR